MKIPRARVPRGARHYCRHSALRNSLRSNAAFKIFTVRVGMNTGLVVVGEVGVNWHNGIHGDR